MRKTTRLIAFLLIVSLLVTSLHLPAFAAQPLGEEELSLPEQEPHLLDLNDILAEDESLRGSHEKHFFTKSGTKIAVLYPQAVHYEKNGAWENIDNTLSPSSAAGAHTRAADRRYTNAESNLSVSLAERGDSDSLIVLSRSGHTLRYSLRGAQSAPLSQTEPEQAENPAVLTRLSTEALYSDILPQVDLQVILSGQSVKENLILKSPSAPSCFTFDYTPGTLQAVWRSPRRIEFLAPGEAEPAFVLTAPLLFDAAGAVSDFLSLSLSQENGLASVTLTADPAWLSAPERVYPITVDPVVTGETGSAYADDTFTTEIGSANHAQGDRLMLGASPSTGKARAYLRILNLPEIDRQTSTLVNARLYFAPIARPASAIGKKISIHRITSDWTADGLAAPTAPRAEAAPLDWQYLTSSQPLSFDVTRVIDDWYADFYGQKRASGDSGLLRNTGVMLQMPDVQSAQNILLYLCSAEYPSAGARPVLAVEYLDCSGVEPFWDYQTQTIGARGVGHLHSFQQNLTFFHETASTVGGALSAAIQTVYSQKSDESGWDLCVAPNWRLSFMQTIYQTGTNPSNYTFRYIDADGSSHSFFLSDDTDNTYRWKDETGLGYTLAYQNSDLALTDKSGAKLLFRSSGDRYFLYRITDPNGRAVSIAENTDQNCYTLTDSAGRALTVSYQASGGQKLVTRIDEPNGFYSLYSRDLLGRLSSITRYTPQGNVADAYTFSYQTVEFYGAGANAGTVCKTVYPLTGITNQGRTLRYDYLAESPQSGGRIHAGLCAVSQISEFMTENGQQIPGQKLALTRPAKNTRTLTDPGEDGLFATSDDYTYTQTFDFFGRLITVADQTGMVSMAAYRNDQTARHKLSLAGTATQSIPSLLHDPDFESASALPSSAWQATEGASLDATGGVLQSHAALLTRTTPGTSSVTAASLNESPAPGSYTLSAWCKTENIPAGNSGAALTLTLTENDQSRTLSSRSLTGQNGWTRLSIDFILAGETISSLGASLSATGSAAFDNFELTCHNGAPSQNLARIDCFSTTYYTQPTTSYVTPTLVDGRESLTLQSGDNSPRNLGQFVSVSGQKGDTFFFSAFAKAQAFVGESHGTGSSTFGLYAVFYRENGSASSSQSASFNAAVTDRQFAGAILVAPFDYSRIAIYLDYSYNYGPVCFDSVSLVRDAAQSYTYDQNGNLVSSSVYAKSQTTNAYQNSSLALASSPFGSCYEYVYDGCQNILLSRTAQGVGSGVSYDSAGNPTRTTVASARSLTTSLTPGQTYFLRPRASRYYLTCTPYAGFYPSIAAFSGQTGQTWTVSRNEDGSYLLSPSSNSSIGLALNSTGEALSLSEQGSSFTLLPDSFGGYQIICQNKALAGSGVTLSLQTYEPNDPAQSWTFEQIDQNLSLGEEIYVAMRCSISTLYLGCTAGGSVTSGEFRLDPSFIIRLLRDEESGAYRIATQQNTEHFLLSGTYTQFVPNLSTASYLFTPIRHSDGTWSFARYPENTNYLSLREDGTVDTQNTAVTGFQKFVLTPVSPTMITSAAYDSSQNFVISSTDNRGNVTTTEYETLPSGKISGRPLAVLTSTGSLTLRNAYSYDELGRLTSSVLQRKSGSILTDLASVTYTYDERSRLTSLSRGGTTYSFAYDLWGNTTEVAIGTGESRRVLVSHQYLEYNGAVFQTVYGNGSAQLYHYDNRGFLTSVTYGQKAASGEISWEPTPAVTYSYSPEGRLIARSSSATAQSFAYDFLGRVVRSSTTGSGRQNHTIDQTYDPYNRLDSFTETIGQTSRTTKAFYSPTGELTGLSLSGEDSPSVLYEYDELLRLKKRTLPNGRVTEYRYLDAGSNRTTSLVSAVIEDGVALLYSYDARGNILTIKKEQGGSTSLLFEYTYDDLGQLTREDDLQRHIRTQYFYDGNGNITNQNKQNITGSNVVSGALFGQATWTYGDSNWKDLLTSYNGITTAADSLGNIGYYNGRLLNWHNRRLSGVSGVASYTYDADGLLVAKTDAVTGLQVRFYRNGSLITGIEENWNLTRYFYDTSGSILGFISGGSYFYYLKNLQGDVVGITDSSGTVLGTYRYDAWGALQAIEGAEQGSANYSLLESNPFRYRGYFYDKTSGLYYLNSRYYSPELKRFLSADGYVSTGQGITGYNMFAYCGNNPVNRKDPTGQFWITVLIVAAVTVVCTVALSGCSAQSTSDVGAAKPYVDMPGSEDPTSPNCYAYAIGSSVNEQPGETSGRIPKKWNDVHDVGRSVEADLKAKGYTVREISGPDAKVYDNEFKIALRVGTHPYAYNQYTGQLYYDYHFMRQTSTGQWAEKHGYGGASILWDPGMTPDTIPWTLGSSLYYDSPIIYYAVGN